MTSRKEKPEESEALSSNPSAVSTAADASADTASASSPTPRRKARTSARTPAATGEQTVPARKRRSGKATAGTATPVETNPAVESAAADSVALSAEPAADETSTQDAKPAGRRIRRTTSSRVAAVSAMSVRMETGAVDAETSGPAGETSPLSAGADEAAAPARRPRAVRAATRGRRAAAGDDAVAAGDETTVGDSASVAPPTDEGATAPRQRKSRSRSGVKTARAAAAAPAEAVASLQDAPSSAAPAVEKKEPEVAQTVDGEENAIDASRRKAARGGKGRQRQEGKAAAHEPSDEPPALVLHEITPPAVQEKSLVPAIPDQSLPVPVETEDGNAPAGEAAEAGADEEGARRRSRRGRRGGRGRNRKNRQAVETAEGRPADVVAATEADADEEGETFGDDDEGLEPVKKGGVRAAAVKAKAAASTGRQRMFISILPGEQVEVALAEEGVLLEYYLDMLHQKKLKGNIYKGVIHNIDTNLQAAFVSYGAGKNGFLQIDEVHPEYWLTHHEPAKGKKYPPIQKVLKAGQEVLVQVVKEPNGSKGAFLTTWLSLAGRFLVLTPGQEQIGVSRKVDNDEERARLREMMNGIDPGEGLGVIVRTVSAGVTKTILRSDLQYLKRVWKDIRKKATEVSAPALIHEEPGLPERAVRDYLTDDVCEIWVDNEALADSIRDTVSQLFPRKKDLVRLHSDTRHTLWERFNLRRQLDQIYAREVTLPSGGRLVFDQTEALMAVDINSGKISGKVNFESMAFKTNMEAAESIARQLKLRDIGGQVVIDFIEMRDRKHVQEVEKTLRTAMKNDRARHDVGRMSSFGLLELVRQRMGSSALAISMEPCPHCNGTGQRRNREWQALQALRDLRSQLRVCQEERLRFETTAEVGLYLLNHKRDTLRDMETSFGKGIEICLRP